VRAKLPKPLSAKGAEAFGFSLAPFAPRSRVAPACPAFCHVPSGRDGRGPQQKRRNTMTDTNTAQSTASKAPTHLVYHVREFDGREGKKSFWTRIGSAWAHADGKGFNVQIDVVPLDGRVTLRVITDKKD
jgi:hypothetical protein